MKITQVRNATLILEFAGQRFLVDPMLANKEAYPGFEGTARAELRFPFQDLPLSLTALADVDAVIVTHTHLDHWDEAAVAALPKGKPFFVQHEQDAALLRSQGFTHLTILTQTTEFQGITLIKTACQHGSCEAYAHPQMAEILGQACGVIFKHSSEKTVYLAGDTIWTDNYERTLRQQQPDVIILNTGFAHVNGFGAIIMGQEDVRRTLEILPQAHIFATHMDAVNHCLLSRQELRAYVAAQDIEHAVHVPNDGETVTF